MAQLIRKDENACLYMILLCFLIEVAFMIVVLAGGVGAARFLQGVVQLVPQEQLTVIANTGDDRDFSVQWSHGGSLGGNS